MLAAGRRSCCGMGMGMGIQCKMTDDETMFFSGSRADLVMHNLIVLDATGQR